MFQRPDQRGELFADHHPSGICWMSGWPVDHLGIDPSAGEDLPEGRALTLGAVEGSYLLVLDLEKIPDVVVGGANPGGQAGPLHGRKLRLQGTQITRCTPLDQSVEMGELSSLPERLQECPVGSR